MQGGTAYSVNEVSERGRAIVRRGPTHEARRRRGSKTNAGSRTSSQFAERMIIADNVALLGAFPVLDVVVAEVRASDADVSRSAVWPELRREHVGEPVLRAEDPVPLWLAGEVADTGD